MGRYPLVTLDSLPRDRVRDIDPKVAALFVGEFEIVAPVGWLQYQFILLIYTVVVGKKPAVGWEGR